MSQASPHIEFDICQSVSYDPDTKRLFHGYARRQLKRLAGALGLSPTTYDLRSNYGGMAVSGEITLHGEQLYVQACQPATGHDTGIMFRSCEGRHDYTGGPNHYVSLNMLHTPEALATYIRQVFHG